MYKFRIEGKNYIATNTLDTSKKYVISYDDFREMTRNNKQKINDLTLPDTFVEKFVESHPNIKLIIAEQENPLNNLRSSKDAKDSKKTIEISDKNLKKLKKKKKDGKSTKSNRKKSRKIKRLVIRIAAGVMAVIMAWAGISALKKKLSSKDNDHGYTIGKSVDYKEDDNKLMGSDIVKEEAYIDKTVENDTLDFYYDEYNNASEESAKNVIQYVDFCKKYGDIYGEDYRLLMGTLAQELNGIHKLELNTPAVGVSQIEKTAWLNTCVKAYNIKTNQYDEKWLIGPNSEDTINDEEFNKRPKSGDIIEKFGKENTINIETVEGSIWARAMIDSYNAEQAYKNGALKSISENDFPAYVKARENKGPIVYKTLEYGDDWKNHLSVTNNGDDNYFNKVYTYADRISKYCDDNGPYITRVFDGKKMVIFAINAIPENNMVKTK